jgi:hypothetical protein
VGPQHLEQRQLAPEVSFIELLVEDRFIDLLQLG